MIVYSLLWDLQSIFPLQALHHHNTASRLSECMSKLPNCGGSDHLAGRRSDSEWWLRAFPWTVDVDLDLGAHQHQQPTPLSSTNTNMQIQNTVRPNKNTHTQINTYKYRSWLWIQLQVLLWTLNTMNNLHLPPNDWCSEGWRFVETHHCTNYCRKYYTDASVVSTFFTSGPWQTCLKKQSQFVTDFRGTPKLQTNVFPWKELRMFDTYVPQQLTIWVLFIASKSDHNLALSQSHSLPPRFEFNTLISLCL